MKEKQIKKNFIKEEDIKIIYESDRFCPWCVYKDDNLMDSFSIENDALNCKKNLLEIAKALNKLK